MEINIKQSTSSSKVVGQILSYFAESFENGSQNSVILIGAGPACMNVVTIAELSTRKIRQKYPNKKFKRWNCVEETVQKIMTPSAKARQLLDLAPGKRKLPWGNDRKQKRKKIPQDVDDGFEKVSDHEVDLSSDDEDVKKIQLPVLKIRIGLDGQKPDPGWNSDCDDENF
ncbi:uncharacterized protein V1516DRAFT_666821 [Lipomyces oligophaga]|uniref:uncharacterized protein n=1 Tax=Lipomyces oligophaga TaxID=45792 RepID=UPI0034CDD7AD